MNQLATFDKEKHQEMDNLQRKCCLKDKSGVELKVDQIGDLSFKAALRISWAW